MAETIRLRSLVSEIANGREIHMLRPGTFTDMGGRSFTFTAEGLRAAAARPLGRGLPITENHDFGRAVGRIVKLRADEAGNVYGTPRWNKNGQALLADEVYDAFSSEISVADDAYQFIGGSLTNYPAVDGLEPVALAAPHEVAIDAPGGAQRATQETSMADNEVVDTTEPAAPPAAPTIDPAMLAREMAALNLSGDMAQRITDMVRSSVMAQFEQVRAQAEQQARAEIARFRREQDIVRLAQDMTTPTLERQHALPLESERLAKFLNGLGDAQRQEAQALLRHILDNGLVAFDEIGGAGEGRDENAAEAVLERVEQIKASKIASGMSASLALSAAIQTVGKDAYNRARAAQKGGR